MTSAFQKLEHSTYYKKKVTEASFAPTRLVFERIQMLVSWWAWCLKIMTIIFLWVSPKTEHSVLLFLNCLGGFPEIPFAFGHCHLDLVC